MTGDARPGAIVELRSWEDHKGQQRHSLTTRSDLPLDHQVTAEGATWLDRHLIDRDPPPLGGENGRESCREACVSTCRSRWSPVHLKNKKHKKETRLSNT